MNSPYTPTHLAEGAIRRGILRLADKYPFHARVLERFRLVASPTVGTMGVTASRSGVELHFNPDFVLSLPADQLSGALLHEVFHVVFGHIITLDTSKYPDDWALTVALEVTVNEYITEPLPAGVILLEQFPKLPPRESSDQRYQRLKKVRERFDLESLQRGTAEGGTGDEGGEGEDKDEKAQAPSATEGKSPRILDNHDVWGEALQDPQAAQQALADLVQAAAMDAGGLPQALLDALAQGVGTMPGHHTQIVQVDRRGELNWRQLLRYYVGRITEPRPVFHRPPRRFPQLLGIVPGRRRLSSRATVVAVIDTSGSITDEFLAMMDGELARLSRSHKVQVVECDCEIHRVFRYKDRLGEVTGRGGTDFRPPLESAFLRSLQADLVIYLTDGQGPAPEKAPLCPVIWCLVPGGESPAPWGRVVRMTKDGPA